LNDLAKVNSETIDLLSLKQADLVGNNIRYVSIIDSGELSGAYTIVGIRTTKGAKDKIIAAGGKVEV